MEKPGDSGFYSQWEVPVDVMYWVVRVGSEMLSGFILVVVGDGRRVYFWHDAWCRDWILFWRTLFQIALDCRRQRFFCALLFEFYGRCFGGGGGGCAFVEPSFGLCLAWFAKVMFFHVLFLGDWSAFWFLWGFLYLIFLHCQIIRNGISFNCFSKLQLLVLARKSG